VDSCETLQPWLDVPGALPGCSQWLWVYKIIAVRVPGKSLQLEEVAEKPSGALGHDGLFGSAMACRRAARFASHARPRVPGLPRADKIADHDQAGRDPDARLERLFCAQLADRFDERQPRPHRALRVVLVRLGITEIYEHSVAHVLGHEAVEPGDRM